jgi:hypothetical protein
VGFDLFNRFSANQEISRILWNPKVHYRIHKCLPPVPILRPYQSISPGPRLSVRIFRNVIRFHGEELLAPRPNPQVGGPPLVGGCPRLLIQYIRSYPPYWRPFLHPQPEDARAVVTGTHSSQMYHVIVFKKFV